MPRLPDRWLDYTNIGNVIANTRFITFKVPLSQKFMHVQPENIWFTPQLLLEYVRERNHQLGMIIDLTFTTKYYQPAEFIETGVKYKKIFVPGHDVPKNKVVREFFKAVDEFLESTSEDCLVGVHCTHGVNRTGYMVCRYMIERLGIEPEEALKAYAEARGYPVERQNYIDDLKQRSKIENYSDAAIEDDEADKDIENGRQNWKPGVKKDCPNFHQSDRHNSSHNNCQGKLRRQDSDDSNKQRWRDSRPYDRDGGNSQRGTHGYGRYGNGWSEAGNYGDDYGQFGRQHDGGYRNYGNSGYRQYGGNQGSNNGYQGNRGHRGQYNSYQDNRGHRGQYNSYQGSRGHKAQYNGYHGNNMGWGQGAPEGNWSNNGHGSDKYRWQRSSYQRDEEGKRQRQNSGNQKCNES